MRKRVREWRGDEWGEAENWRGRRGGDGQQQKTKKEEREVYPDVQEYPLVPAG